MGCSRLIPGDFYPVGYLEDGLWKTVEKLWLIAWLSAGLVGWLVFLGILWIWVCGL